MYLSYFNLNNFDKIDDGFWEPIQVACGLNLPGMVPKNSLEGAL